MKRYRAEVTIRADGVPLKAGDVFDADEIDAGCLASMLRQRQCVEVADAPPRDPATVIAEGAELDLTLDQDQPGPALEADPDNRPEPGDDGDEEPDPDDDEPTEESDVKPKRLGRGKKPKIGREKH